MDESGKVGLVHIPADTSRQPISAETLKAVDAEVRKILADSHGPSTLETAALWHNSTLRSRPRVQGLL